MAQEYLKRVPTSSGNSYKFTISVWAKRNSDATSHRGHLFNAGPSESSMADSFAFYLNSGHNLHLNNRISNTYGYYATPIARYQDYSGWTHYLASIDTTQYGDQEVKVVEYVNGVLQNGNNNSVVPILQDYESWVNQRVGHYIGKRLDNLNGNWHGQMMDFYLVDGLSLTPDTFGFYKVGDGFVSAGTTYATDFRPGQWVPKAPSVVKNTINNNGGFGVNGVYLPLNDSSNFGADFHTTPNSIIKLQEDLQQPKVSIASTAQAGLAYTDVLRADPYAANLVLALPFVSGGLGTDGTSSGSNPGFGDYSTLIKGSGTLKGATLTGSPSIAATDAYYGSASQFIRSNPDYIRIDNDSDFNMGSGDFTVECWVKPQSGTHFGVEVAHWNGSSNRRSWKLDHTSQLLPRFAVSSDGTGANTIEITSGIAITTGQWTHLAGEKKGNVGTIYVNGVATGISTIFPTSIYSNTDDVVTIGVENTSGTNPLEGFIQDVRVYKGVAKYKGGFDVPKPYTPVGIATWRAVPDCTANNFATWNFVGIASASSTGLATQTNGSLTLTHNNAAYVHNVTNVGMSTGKWYAEMYVEAGGGISGIGIAGDNFQGGPGGKGGYQYHYDGKKYVNGTLRNYSGNSFTSGDVIGIAFDANLGIMTAYKNGVSQGTLADNISVGAGGTTHYFFGCYLYSLSAPLTKLIHLNCGQNPTFSGTLSAGSTQRNSDANGVGEFRYEPPAGHLALCAKNLPTPAISDPGKYFKTQTWTGDGSDFKSITGIGFTPDLVWIKNRTGADNSVLFDSVRGEPGGLLLPSGTSKELGNQTLLRNLSSDGFVVGNTYNGSGNNATNGNNNDFVAWCWQAGAGTTSANTDGTINSVISVNQDAGFSIVSYTGNGTSGATVGHGIGKSPKMVLIKNRSSNQNWDAQIFGTVRMALNDTQKDQGNFTSSFSPTTFSLADSSIQRNTSGVPYIAYCWAEIEGFSKFGQYVGNNTGDNAFVYCGFKPAFVIIKNLDAADNWSLIDSSRQSINPARAVLRANLINAESIQAQGAGFDVDLLSNGFRIRGANSEIGDPVRYMFAAWAESPFQTANAK